MTKRKKTHNGRPGARQRAAVTLEEPPLPTWWANAVDVGAALEHAVSPAVVPALLRPALTAALSRSMVRIPSPSDAASCITAVSIPGSAAPHDVGPLHVLPRLRSVGLGWCRQETIIAVLDLLAPDPAVSSVSYSEPAMSAVRYPLGMKWVFNDAYALEVTAAHTSSSPGMEIGRPVVNRLNVTFSPNQRFTHVMQRIVRLTMLASLLLCHCRLSQPDTRILTEGLPHLQHLRIGAGCVRDAGALLFLPRLRKLEALDLSSCDPVDHTIVTALSSLPCLVKLVLQECPLIDDGCLRAAATLPQLTELNIAACRRVSGAQALQELAPLAPRIAWLSAGYNSWMDDAALRVVVDLGVKHLAIPHCRSVTADALASARVVLHVTQ